MNQPLSTLLEELKKLAELWGKQGLSIKEGEIVINALPRLIEELEAAHIMAERVEQASCEIQMRIEAKCWLSRWDKKGEVEG